MSKANALADRARNDNFADKNHSHDLATTLAPGMVQLATPAEHSAGETNEKAATPGGVATLMVDYVNSRLAEPKSIRRETEAFTLTKEAHKDLYIITTSTVVNVNIPNNTNFPVDIGTEFEIISAGTGSVSFSSASGVAIQGATGQLRLTPDKPRVCFLKIDTNKWLVSGEATQKKVTTSSLNPSGGSDGDVWIKYVSSQP